MYKGIRAVERKLIKKSYKELDQWPLKTGKNRSLANLSSGIANLIKVGDKIFYPDIP